MERKVSPNKLSIEKEKKLKNENKRPPKASKGKTKPETPKEKKLIQDTTNETPKNEIKKNKKKIPIRKRIYFNYTFRTIICLIIFIISLVSCIFLLKISLSNTKEEKANYSEESKIDFKVYLKKNNFYETNYLNKDMLYVASLIDKIKIDFDYLFKTDKIQNIDFTYSVIGKLSIKDSQTKKVYLEKSYELSKEQEVKMIESSSKEISKIIDIDYDYYNSLANDFKSLNGLNTESTLTVYMLINKKSENPNSYINSADSIMNIIIPLSEKSVEIKLDYKEINQKSEIINNSRTLVINQNNVLIGLSSLLVSIIFLVKFIRKISALKVNYRFDNYIKKILKNYDRLIVESKNLISFEGKEIIKVNKFTELLDVHDNLQLPIMYYNITKHIKSYFFIIHNDIVYLYVLKAIDLEE